MSQERITFLEVPVWVEEKRSWERNAVSQIKSFSMKDLHVLLKSVFVLHTFDITYRLRLMLR